jgi:hypothetical protein
MVDSPMILPAENDRRVANGDNKMGDVGLGRIYYICAVSECPPAVIAGSSQTKKLIHISDVFWNHLVLGVFGVVVVEGSIEVGRHRSLT